jgi:hypothetical protein
MEAEDLVLQTLRGDLRALRIQAENYKIQQRQVDLAYSTVESALESLVQPSAPTGGLTAAAATGGAAGGGGIGGGGAAAALTNQLLMAQSSLVRAQNSMLMVWVNYQTTRYQLYRDLELMPLDSRGVWIDDDATCDTGARQPGEPAIPAGPGAKPAEPEPERIPEPKPGSRTEAPEAGNPG